MNERFGYGMCVSKVCLHIGALDANCAAGFSQTPHSACASTTILPRHGTFSLLCPKNNNTLKGKLFDEI